MDEVREQLTASTAAAAEGARWRGEAEAAREKTATHSATAARLEDQLRHAQGELNAALGDSYTIHSNASICTYCASIVVLFIVPLIISSSACGWNRGPCTHRRLFNVFEHNSL